MLLLFFEEVEVEPANEYTTTLHYNTVGSYSVFERRLVNRLDQNGLKE